MTDVKAWLYFRGEAARVCRGSGLLAVLLAGAENILNTAGADTSSGQVTVLITISGRTAPLVPVSSRGPRTAA